MKQQRIILHIDFNSYFATAEQLCNPFLRGKPIAIGGSPGTRTIVVAASMEAKRYGVKTGMNHIEARQRCPHILFIDGDPVKYSELTQTFIDIAKRYTDRLEVYSIDEVFLDMTGWAKSYHHAAEIARQIKRNLRQEIGDYLSCSVGIAPNRMLAKLASSMQKPDGLTSIEPKDIANVLSWVELTDIPGIGPRLKIRLFDMGIRTLNQLGKYPITELQRVFGPNNGVTLSEMGRGVDTTEIPSVHEVEPVKSMGHTYTLMQDTKSRDEVYAVLLRLAEKVGRRLRRDGYEGRHIWVYLRWDDFSGSHEGKTLKYCIDDGYEIYSIARSLLEPWPFFKAVRLIGVGVTLLKQHGKQMSVLQTSKRKEHLVQAQDSINDRFGEFSIQRARTLTVSLRRKVGGFKEPHQFH